MAKAVKLKAKARTYVCQNKTQVMEAITEIGNANREILRLETEINDITAAAIAERKDVKEDLKQRVSELSEGVQAWCEVNRATICKKGKTANLTTGEVSWRTRPPKVNLRGMEGIIKTLKSKRLKRFIRTKEEVNKEAILAEPEKVADIKGISIQSGIEDFEIKPFEVKTENSD